MQLLLMVKVCVKLSMRILTLVSPADEVKDTMEGGEDLTLMLTRNNLHPQMLRGSMIVEVLYRLRLMMLLKMNMKAAMTSPRPSLMNL